MRRSVVSSRESGDRQRRRRWSNVGRGSGRRVVRVISCVGAGDGDVRHGHGLGRSYVRIAKESVAVIGEDVAFEAIVRECDRRLRRAVVDLVDAGGGDGQWSCRYVGRGGRGGVERVVRGVRSGDGDAAYRNRFSGAGIFVDEAGGRITVREHVARDAIIGENNGGRSVSVVNLVDAGRRDRQRLSSNARDGGCGGVERVVRGVGSGNGNAAHRNRFADSHNAVGEARAGVAIGENVAGYAVVGQGYRGRRAAIEYFVDAGGGNGQSQHRDVGGRTGRRVERVVRGVRAGNRDSAHRNRLANRDRLVGETRARIAARENIAGNAVVGERHRRRRAAVVHFVDARGRNRQRFAGDVGRGARRGVRRIVRGVRTGNRDAAHRNRLAGGYRFIGETRARVAARENVAGNAIVGESHRRRRAAVVHLVDARGRNHQRFRRDVGRGAGRGVRRIVRGVRAGDRDSADRYGLAGRHVLVGEARARVAGGENVASNAIVGERRLRRDVGGGAGRGVETGVAGGVGTRDGDSAHRNRDAVASVLRRKRGRRVAHRDVVAGRAIVGEGNGGRSAAIVNLIDAAGRDREGLAGDARRGCRGAVRRVVRGVGAGDGNSAHRYDLANSHRAVRETRGGVAVGEDVTGNAIVGKRHRRGRTAIEHLIDAACGDGQGFRGDVGGGGRRGVETDVAGRVRTRDGDAAHRNRHAVANALRRKRRAGIADCDVVADRAIVGERNGGRSAAIVNLIDAGGRNGESFSRDIRRGAGARVGRVVGGIGAGNRNACYRNGFSHARARVGETGARVAVREDIARHAIVGESYRGGGGSVKTFVDAHGRDRQCALRDVGRGRRGGVDRIVGRGGAGNRDAADRNGLAAAGRFAGEASAGVAVGEDVARNAIVGENHGGRCSAVVNLIDAGCGDRQRTRVNRQRGRSAAAGVAGIARKTGPRARSICAHGDARQTRAGNGRRAADIGGRRSHARTVHRKRNRAAGDRRASVRKRRRQTGGSAVRTRGARYAQGCRQTKRGRHRH